jgi:hypothetical protein
MTRLTGGLFQDQSGTPLINGYLLWELSADCRVTATNQVLASGQVCRILLDMIGSVGGNQSLWSNADLTPVDTHYLVRLFDYQGSALWSSPQRITIPSGASYDLGLFVPANF